MSGPGQEFVRTVASASRSANRFLHARGLQAEDRNDILAEALAWCWQNRDNYSLTTSLETWFVNAVRDAYKAWMRYETREAAEAISDIPTGDTTLSSAEAYSSARALWRALPAEYRRVTVLEEAGYTRAEMEGRGITRRTIDEARARIAQLRKLLPDPYEYTRVLRAYNPNWGSHEEIASNLPVANIDTEIERWYMGKPGGSTEPMDERRALALHEAHMVRSTQLQQETQMGIYEFECPNGHITDMMVPLELRPATKTCGHDLGSHRCTEEAKFVVSATPTTFRAQDRKAFKRVGR